MVCSCYQLGDTPGRFDLHGSLQFVDFAQPAR
jgi:hypothetical protein